MTTLDELIELGIIDKGNLWKAYEDKFTSHISNTWSFNSYVEPIPVVPTSGYIWDLYKGIRRAPEFSDKQVGELIRMAADVLEKYGWIKNARGNTIAGFCTLGAIEHAAFGEPQSIFAVSTNCTVTALYQDASRKFLQWLRATGIEEHAISQWNDHPDRTMDEVILYMRKFADEMAPEAPARMTSMEVI